MENFHPNLVRCTFSEPRLAVLWNYYKILLGFPSVVPHPIDRIDKPPSGSITIYEEHLRAGLCFPLHSFFI